MKNAIKKIAVKFTLLTAILNLFDHVVITSKKFTLTSFDAIANELNENKPTDVYTNAMNFLRIKLNDKIVTEKQFFTLLKTIKNNREKFHAQIEYLFLFPTKSEIVYTLLDKTIKTKFVPLYVLQTINEIDKNFAVSLPKSMYNEFEKSDYFAKIIKHVDNAIRKIYTLNHVRSMYKI